MFLWIRDQKWLPTLLLALISLFILGGLDFLIQGLWTIPAAVIFAASVVFSRSVPLVAVSLFSIGLFVPHFLNLEPQISQLSATITLLIVAAFAGVRDRWIGFGLNIILGTASYLWVLFTTPDGSSLYGIVLPNADAKLAIGIAGLVAMIAVNGNAWFVGRLLITRVTHVGTEFDRELLERQISSTQLALAEQDRRFGIARDVNDILLEQISSTMTAAEAGIYSVKSDPSVAPRLLVGLLDGVRKAYGEIRRLSDLLGLQKVRSFALPGMRDLNSLFISYREFGFSVNFRQTGDPMSLVAGLELVIYRIIFESLENIRRHTPLGTAVDINFMWQGTAMQLVIKDNGEENARSLENDVTGYTALEDHRSLVQNPAGAGLLSMQERASLYEGGVEFSKVPGVGFTVSVAFPNITKYAKGD